MQCGTPALWGLTDWISFGAVIGCPKMYRLSYRAYFHNLDAVCMSVCACFGLFVHMYWRGLGILPWVCPRVHMLHMCTRAPEFRGSDSFDSYTCQWPDPSDNPCCRHKADRKAPISPPRHWAGLWRQQGGWRDNLQPFSTIHSPHSTPLTHEWGSNWFFFTRVHFPTRPDTERGFCAHLPFLVYFISGRRLIEREGKKGGSLSESELTLKVLHLEGISGQSIKRAFRKEPAQRTPWEWTEDLAETALFTHRRTERERE